MQTTKKKKPRKWKSVMDWNATQPKATQSQVAVVSILSFYTEILNADG